MTNHRSSRRHRKSSGRRVWVFSDVNRDLRPEQVARIITSAGLEQARLEAEAQAEAATRAADASHGGEEVSDA